MTSVPLRYRLALAAYQGALRAAMPLVWRYFGKRGQKDPAYLEHWEERQGLGADFDADVWIHAVSLGEFRSAEPLIAALMSKGLRIVVTHATPAGRRASQASLATDVAAGRVQIVYAPVDLISFWAAFFQRMTPRIGVVMEMEFWPGMIEAARQAEVPLWLTNAQVPSKSLPRARWVRRVLGLHPVGAAAGVLAKSERMAERFRALGAKHVTVVGETRFDIPPPPSHVAAGRVFRETLGGRPIMTFASVVSGEEAVYLNAVRELLAGDAPPMFIWVPRAPEAFDNTVSLLEKAGLSVGRRTRALSSDLALLGEPDFDVLVGDSFGEMFFYLSAADVVSVGGGFVEKGAHNVIEPLALGKPVVTGPYVWTIEFPGEEARAAGVLSICETPDALASNLVAALDADPIAYSDFHAAYTGASNRIAAVLEKEMAS